MIIKQVSGQPFTYLVTEGESQYGTIDEYHKADGTIVYTAVRFIGGFHMELESKSFTVALNFIHST